MAWGMVVFKFVPAPAHNASGIVRHRHQPGICTQGIVQASYVEQASSPKARYLRHRQASSTFRHRDPRWRYLRHRAGM